MDEHLLRAMAVVQDFVQGAGELVSTLQEIVAAATEALEVTATGLTIADDRGRLTTLVHAGQPGVVAEIEQTQHDDDRGPCVDAVRTRQVVEIDDIRTDDRWPAFAAAAASHGVRSTLSMPIVIDSNGVSALSFYDHRAAYFDEEKRDLAQPFAGQCVVAGLYWSAASEAAGLARAMETRSVIEQAKGVLMATTGCSAGEAFDLLRQQSQMENRKLRDIAQEIILRQQR